MDRSHHLELQTSRLSNSSAAREEKRRILHGLTVSDDVVRISIRVVDAEGNEGLIVDAELTRGQMNGNGEDQQIREDEMHRHGRESRSDDENCIGLIHRLEFE